MPDTKVYSTQQAAALCGVDRRSMLRWVKAGVLPSYQTGGGRWRIREGDLLSFMRDRGMPIPTSLRPESARVAIIDDDAAFVAALRRLIARERPDAEILEAQDGFSGGLLVAERHPDLLFLDVQMDGLDGLEVCRRLRANPSLSSVRVVVLSGYLTPESQKGFRELGVESCHSKPVAPQVIHELLAEHLPPARDAVISSLVGHGEA